MTGERLHPDDRLSQSEGTPLRDYVLTDYDGDGIAEQLRVYTGLNGKILKRNRKPAIDYVTDAPFEALCALPIPHRHHGLSVAELIDDLVPLVHARDRCEVGAGHQVLLDERVGDQGCLVTGAAGDADLLCHPR